MLMCLRVSTLSLHERVKENTQKYQSRKLEDKRRNNTLSNSKEEEKINHEENFTFWSLHFKLSYLLMFGEDG